MKNEALRATVLGVKIISNISPEYGKKIRIRTTS